MTFLRSNRLALELGLLVVFAVLLFFLPDMLRSVFGRASVSYLALLINAVSLAILALSWDMLARTGQLSLAHAAFYGAGAYTVAVLFRTTDLPLWSMIPVAGVVGGVLALGLGAVTLRLHGIYFAIATLAFTEMLRAFVQQLPTAVAGGTAGLTVPALIRPVFVAGEMERWEVAYLRNEQYFWLYGALLVLTILVSIVLQRSRFRSAFTAIRTNEAVAAVMGVRPSRYKILAFVLSSFLVGMLGSIDALRIGSVNPHETFAVSITVFALVTPIFGGLYTTLGPILGAGVLAGLEETLRRIFHNGYLIGYGLMLVLAILFMPRGLVGLLSGFTRRRTHTPKPPSGPGRGKGVKTGLTRGTKGGKA